MRRLWQAIKFVIITGVLLAACSSNTGEVSPDLFFNNDLSNPSSNSDESTNTDGNNYITIQPTSQALNFTQDYGMNEIADRDYSEYDIITLLPPDAIPAIDDPVFLTVEEADDEYAPDELILGVEFNGNARAYSIGFLSRHEIVNDTVGGVKLLVTW